MQDNTTDFVAFPKMARLSRECIISEKIDGTNAQIHIVEAPYGPSEMPILAVAKPVAVIGARFLFAGSRNRYITPGDDNYGFAKWVDGNASALAALGPGRHYGEWWGGGIQRGYGLAGNDKRFSLFNVQRWCLHNEEPGLIRLGDKDVPPKYQEKLPACVGLVPVLFRGIFNTEEAKGILGMLQRSGSQAVRGFMKPEGIVVWHTAANVGFKKTIDGDQGKSL